VPAPSKPTPSKPAAPRASKAGNSEPPPSQQIPGQPSGGGLYLAGAVILVLGAVALAWRSCSAQQQPVVQQTTATATVSAPPQSNDPPPLYAPPPPPKIEEEPDAGKPPPKSTGTGGPTVAAGSGPCGASCTGSATSALTTALRSRAQSAQGCYNRALRTSEVSGSMTVSVQVGPSGQVCSASLANDSVHSGEVSSCVLGRFRGQTFPPPSGGCVTVNIPISFTIKQ
jgi:outer membrane biosynthesis protein TonB